jgi:transcription termination/antitermination protein NusG
MMEQKKWLVFYTKSRQEKKSALMLEKKHFQVFLPLHKVLRQWADRKKKVEVPLFNSYLFVYAETADIVKILQVPGLAWNVRHNGHPAMIKESEIDMIKRVIESGLTIVATGTESFEEFHKGDKAIVIEGPLAGLTGTLEGEASEHRFVVLLESINQVLRVHLPKHLLRKV